MPVTEIPKKKYFDLAEASRSLCYVERVVKDLMDIYSDVVKTRRKIERETSLSEQDQLEARHEIKMDLLRDLINEFNSTGAEFMDFENGRVHFHFICRGKEVSFVWQYGEDGINYYTKSPNSPGERIPLSGLETTIIRT